MSSGRMIFLYGPPAVGKLTVAQCLAERFGYKVLHNHLTTDAVAPILGRDTDAFRRVLHHFRCDLIAEAERQGINLAYTCVFASGDEGVVADLVRPYDDGRVVFVQLVAPPDELYRRVVLDTRRSHGKLVDVDSLRALLARYDLYRQVEGRTSLRLDLSTLSAEEAADRIVGKVEAQ